MNYIIQGFQISPSAMLRDDVRFQHSFPPIRCSWMIALEHRRVALRIPRALRVDDGDRSALADAQAVRFRAEDAALLREAQLLQPPLQELPGGQAALLVAALRSRLVAAEKDVAAARSGRRSSATSRSRALRNQSKQLDLHDRRPARRRSVSAGISMYPSACDMLVMSPEALKAGTATPSTILTV